MRSTIDLTMERIFRDKAKPNNPKKTIPWKSDIEVIPNINQTFQSGSMTMSDISPNYYQFLDWYISENNTATDPTNTISSLNSQRSFRDIYNDTDTVFSYRLEGVNGLFRGRYSSNGTFYYISNTKDKNYLNYDENYQCKEIFKKYKSFAYKMRERFSYKQIPWEKNNSLKECKEIPWRSLSCKERCNDMNEYAIYLSEDFIPFSEYMEDFQYYKDAKGWFRMSKDKSPIPWKNYKKGKKNPLNSWNLPEEFYDNYDDEIMPRDSVRADGSIIYI